MAAVEDYPNKKLTLWATVHHHHWPAANALKKCSQLPSFPAPHVSR